MEFSMFSNHSRTLGLALACTLAAAPVAAQSLKDALPESTIAYMSLPNISVSIKEMGDMPLAKIWREGEVQDFFADGLKMLEGEWSKYLNQGRQMHKDGMLPFSPDEILKLRLTSVSAAMTGFEITEGDFGPSPKVGVMLHLGFGNSAGTWRQVLETALGMAMAQAPEGVIERSESKVGDITIVSIKAADAPTEMSVNYAFVGNGLLFGTLADEFKATLTNLVEGKKLLSASESFMSVAKNLDMEGAEGESYVQPGRIIDIALNVLTLVSEMDPSFPEEIDPAGIARVIEAFGLRSIHGVGATSTYAGDRCVTKGFVSSPAPERKGFIAPGNKELDLGFLQWVPKDAVSFSSTTIDLMSIYDALSDGLKAYNPQLAEMVMGQLGGMEEQLGLSLKKDLFGAFGNQFISWSMPMAALGTPPEMAFLAKVNDQEGLINTINTIAKLTEGALEIDEIERRGIKAYQLRFNIDMDQFGNLGGMNPLDMFIPTFSFKNGYIVVGLSTSDVKRVFKRMDREDDPSGDIRSNQEFAPYLAKLPKTNLNSLSFTDWKAQFEGVYQLVTSLLAFVPLDEDIPVDLSLLPDSATLTEHLVGGVSWTESDGNGFKTTGIGPWGPEIAALFGVGVIAGAATYGVMSGSMR